MKRKCLNFVVPLLVILLLWQVGSMCLNQYFLPSPGTAFRTLFSIAAGKTIWMHIAASLRRILLGTAAGLVIAVPVGIAMGWYKPVDEVLGTFIRFLYPIPKVVFMPIVIVLMGIGDSAKVFLIFLAIFFPLAIIIGDGVAGIDRELVDVMRSMKAGRMQTLIHLILPACLPEIFTALKATLGTSVALLVITELFASSSGLGYFIMRCMDARDYPEMYAGIIILAIMSAVLYAIIELCEKLFCGWRYR